MAYTPIQARITAQDNFVLIRQQILAILVGERASQKTKATDAGETGVEWDFKVYEERSQPWEAGLNVDGLPTAHSIVNVWFDSDTFDSRSSNVAETQKCNAAYNIDVVGYGEAQNTDAGHTPGDLVAANNAQRTVGLVRSMLMASSNAYLQLPRGTAWDRKIESRQEYQPRLDQRPQTAIVALRMRFNVSFNETGPQYTGVPLATLVTDVHRAEDGEIVATINTTF